MRVKNLEVNVDSKLVANQVNGTCIAKETDMIKYLKKVKALTSTFRAFLIKQVARNPQEKLNPITSPWPFYKWGIDIAGPFPEGPGKVKFLIVAMDYFTKWIEAKPVATITGNQVKKFIWENIVCRFGLPEEIISDNAFLRSSAKLNLSSSSNLLPSCALVKKNMISEFAKALTPL
ncbi:reverse transcriptase domain-containing protein [Tanacetum coccineum]